MNTISMVGLLIGVVFLAAMASYAIHGKLLLQHQLELIQQQYAESFRQCTCGRSVQPEFQSTQRGSPKQ